MSRPVYETEDDRKREKRILDAYAKAWGWTYTRHVQFNSSDCTWRCAGKVVAVGEAKGRTYAHNEYTKGVMLGIRKAARLRFRGRMNSVPVILTFEFTNGMYWHQFDDDTTTYEVGIGGRYDRNDAQDEERLIYIAPWRWSSIHLSPEGLWQRESRRRRQQTYSNW